MPDRLDALLRRLVGRDDASFRDGQREAVEALVEGGARVLCVQRTGWGKSAVYFVATAVMRASGRGPTLLVSPLLSLMRNQIEAAGRLGIEARTINSSTRDSWPETFAEIERDEVDVLLISPERFANERFRDEHLPGLLERCGLLVIDEAHCISDWGHDFRPDYRRIASIVAELPASASVLCTTATANDRVVGDIVDQLGRDRELLTIRGPLDRLSLRLEVVELAHQAERLAWLATHLPRIEGSGIVYCLTVRDTRVVAEWLRSRGIDAVHYAGPDDDAEKIETERQLLANEVKAVAATTALAMGYDKPDLAFVVHFQSPGSPIAYYQQVGRAGRAIESAHGVLLRGAEDERIHDYFLREAFPPPAQVETVIGLLERAGSPVPERQILAEVNIGVGRLRTMLKSLEVDGVVESSRSSWGRTAAAFEYDPEHIGAIIEARRAEQTAIERLGRDGVCLMRALREELDDPHAEDCGRCAVCTAPRFADPLDHELVVEATEFLRRRPLTLEPRKRLPIDLGSGFAIPVDERGEIGRALSVYGDAGWGQVVSRGRHGAGGLDDELVAATAALLAEWSPQPPPAWIAAVPSLRRPELVAAFCERLAEAVGLEFVPCVRQVRETAEQATMANSPQQLENVSGAFEVDRALVRSEPALLVDDTVDSRWTMTEVCGRLRRAGVAAVHPLALAASARG